MAETGRDAMDWHVPEDVPEERCGFTTEYETLNGRGPPSNVTCWRETWRDHERCIWHADVAQKPPEELTAMRVDGKERLDGAVLRSVEMNGRINFDDCVLVEADLTGISMDDASFEDAHLGRANLTEVFLNDAKFSGAALSGADLTGAFLEEANFSKARLHDADLTRASLVDASLTEAHLWEADLSDASLRNADLSDATLRKADLTDAYLRRGDLTDADLHGADLSSAALVRADFTEANLQLTNFTRADLRNATLTNAHVGATNFTKGNLRGVDLTTLDLSNVHLSEVVLESTILDGADLGGKDLKGTRLYDARLKDVYINGATEFGRSGYETMVFESTVPLPDDRTFDDLSFARARRWFSSGWQDLRRLWTFVRSDSGIRENQAEFFARAASDYRTIRRLHEENDMPEGIAPFTVRARNADRRQALAEHRWGRWFTLAGARWTTLYGESPWRVLATSLVVILAGVLIYPYTGLDVPSWFDRLYFSVATFTPLMQAQGLPAPETWATKAVAMTQALLGVVLTALLVAVLDRRITR